MKTRYIIMGLASACLLAAGCVAEQTLKHERGTAIRFGASTTWENGTSTRTEYSGIDNEGDVVHKGSEYERIDWVAGKDQVKILCKAAGGSAVYQVNGANPSGQKSEATSIDAIDGNLVWGEGEHVFFASYPVAGMLSNYDAFGAVDGADASITPVGTDGNAAQISGRIPYVQQVYRVDGENMTEFKPNMNFAHMYAQAVANPATDDGVLLQFHPLVTTFEVTLVNMASDPVSAPLKKVRLVSGNNDLAGSFTADLAKGADPVINEVTPSAFTKKTVTLDFGEGVTLSATKPIKFTFLTLPLTQSEIKLELLFEGGIVKSLDLKYAADSDGVKDDWIEVGACKKVYLSNVTVSNEWEYFIDNLSCEEEGGIGIVYVDVYNDDPTSTSFGEGSAPVQFDTYKKTETGNKIYVPIGKVEYSADGVSGWSTTLPSATFTDPFAPARMASEGIRDKAVASMTAFNDGEKTTSTVDAGQYHRNVLRGTSPVGSSSAPRDLSIYTVEGKARTGNKRVTANCYIVNAPGYYKFPLVYGNAIDQVKNTTGEGVNTASYNPGPISKDYRFLQTFQNYLGNGITSPYILTDTGLDFNDVEAVIVWSDAGSWQEGTVTRHEEKQITNDDLFILDEDHGYIGFFLNRTLIHQGNIVIALRKKASVDPDKTILWSWHIWVSDLKMGSVRMDSKNTAIPELSPVRDYTDFMTYNLGWCEEGITNITSYARAPYYVRVTQQDDKGYHVSQVFKIIERGGAVVDAAMSSGTYYQWGRKDPFLPSTGDVETAILRQNNPYSATSNKYFYADEYQISHTGSSADYGYAIGEKALNYQLADDAGNVGQSIRYPYYYLHNPGTSYYWMRDSDGSTIKFNLWDAEMKAFSSDKLPVKTIYDPCPPGYVVPNKYAFLNFCSKARGTNQPEYTEELTSSGTIRDGFMYFNVIDLNGDGKISDKDFDRGFYFRKNNRNVVEKKTEGGDITFDFKDVVSGRGNGLFFPAAGYRLAGDFTWATSLESDVYEMGLEGWYWTAAPSTTMESHIMIFTTHEIDVTYDPVNYGFYLSTRMTFRTTVGLSIRPMVDE